MNSGKKAGPFPSAKQDATAAEHYVISPQTEAAAYKLAYLDADFMLSDELRPVRLQLELLKPELLQQQAGIENTVVVFGSARIPEPEQAQAALAKALKAAQQQPGDPELERALNKAQRAEQNSRYYAEARKFAQTLANRAGHNGQSACVVITGGGPGIMEAANRGATEAGSKTIGLNIVLPMEQAPNPYITPELCFQFHYFAIRKMHFLMRAKALIAFPGGFGTLDELFEALTLIQTKKIEQIPVLLFGRDYWERVINFQALVEEGMISASDLLLFHYVETAEEACQKILDYCQRQAAANNRQ
ncbi:hypothetical protein SAMN02745165_03275 [Malonomonas rubra DSM 5091]|uniref:AMP nucleosidase n=1 Tax=Malonomonas rubra DSM 5091 TaxID=1122189 RepID=A0A1M6MGN8_MALRU|nr:TIGR00730 family Rossman fold protein [Malonomonas rubra]SHJ82641.1 hypothetical protein SAMN02745165_03275 [Malonomonas rubra DSM 5091]